MVLNRNKAQDLRLIIQILVFASVLIYLLLVPFTLWQLSTIPLIGLGWLTLSSAAHCHIHRKTFKTAFMNRFWDLLLTVVRGSSITLMRIHHIQNHHAQFNSQGGDWMSTHNVSTPRSLKRNYAYFIYGFVNSAHFLSEAVKSSEIKPHLKQKIKIENGLVIGIFWLAFYLNPLTFWLVLAPAWILGTALLVLSNLWNHDNVAEEQEQVKSSTLEIVRDFTSPFFNFFMFNSGYHSIHHLKPNEHWSDYPQLQKKAHNGTEIMGNKLHTWKRIEEKSFIAFFWRYYVTPKREVKARSGLVLPQIN